MNVVYELKEDDVISPNTLVRGDCLDVMGHIPKGLIDLVLTDPPYNLTSNKWDSIIPLGDMWGRVNRIAEDRTPVLLFGSEPFSSNLRMSNIKYFKYDWIWDKTKGGNFLLAKKQPMKSHEIISVFYRKQANYMPIMEVRGKPRKKGGYSTTDNFNVKECTISINNEYYPKSILTFPTGSKNNRGLHPTQKPVKLMEYLIKTYTNEGDTVLDFTMGSGTTAVACVNTNRKFIGIEMDKKYFDIAVERVSKAIEEKGNE